MVVIWSAKEDPFPKFYADCPRRWSKASYTRCKGFAECGNSNFLSSHQASERAVREQLFAAAFRLQRMQQRDRKASTTTRPLVLPRRLGRRSSLHTVLSAEVRKDQEPALLLLPCTHLIEWSESKSHTVLCVGWGLGGEGRACQWPQILEWRYEWLVHSLSTLPSSRMMVGGCWPAPRELEIGATDVVVDGTLPFPLPFRIDKKMA